MPDIGVMGDTLRVNLEFRDWDGYHEDPTEIKYTLYNANKNILKGYQDIELDLTETRTALGKYSFYLYIPQGEELLILQAVAMLNGEKLTDRLPIERSWLTDKEWSDKCNTEVVAMPGTTLKLNCWYRDWDSGELLDPDNPTVIVYDDERHPLMERVNLTDKHRVSTGYYEYFFEVPNGNTPIVVEFTGGILGEKVVVRREIERVWAKDIDLHDYKPSPL